MVRGVWGKFVKGDVVLVIWKSDKVRAKVVSEANYFEHRYCVKVLVTDTYLFRYEDEILERIEQ